jgi:hypothetical protein
MRRHSFLRQVGGANGICIIVADGKREFSGKWIGTDPTRIVKRIDPQDSPILLNDPIPARHVVMESL